MRIRAAGFVTAAHCADQPYDEIRIIGEAGNLRSPAARITACETAICHGGYLGADNNYPNDLLKTPLRITAVGPAALTVASQGGAGPCIGGSGGPLYVTGPDGIRTLAGILSVAEQNHATGRFCAGDCYGRHTNLQGDAGWIGRVIALCGKTPESCKQACK